jgi:hypothetical protein
MQRSVGDVDVRPHNVVCTTACYVLSLVGARVNNGNIPLVIPSQGGSTETFCILLY